MKHYAERLPVDITTVLYKCTCEPPSASCSGFAHTGPRDTIFICKHCRVTNTHTLCDNPPPVPCPESRYSPNDLDGKLRDREFRVAADTFKWLLSEYVKPGRDRDDLVVLLDAIVDKASTLAQDKDKKKPTHYDSPFK